MLQQKLMVVADGERGQNIKLDGLFEIAGKNLLSDGKGKKL